MLPIWETPSGEQVQFNVQNRQGPGGGTPIGWSRVTQAGFATDDDISEQPLMGLWNLSSVFPWFSLFWFSLAPRNLRVQGFSGAVKLVAQVSDSDFQLDQVLSAGGAGITLKQEVQGVNDGLQLLIRGEVCEGDIERGLVQLGQLLQLHTSRFLQSWTHEDEMLPCLISCATQHT